MYHTPIITKDFSAKKITIEKLFNAPLSKVWRAHSDEKIMIQWWGPKSWPASSKSFDFRDGGHWHYYMTGPDGTQVWGWVDYLKIITEQSIEGQDGFCDSTGTRNTEMPSNHWLTQFFKSGDQTRVVVELTFTAESSMQQIIDMGFEAGFSEALGNLDELLPTL